MDARTTTLEVLEFELNETRRHQGRYERLMTHESTDDDARRAYETSLACFREREVELQAAISWIKGFAPGVSALGAYRIDGGGQ
jgi:hypothetical protein